jgi:uncharacterized membrane protein YqhA
MINASRLLRVRYVFLLVSAFSFLSSLYFIGVGIMETVHAIGTVLGHDSDRIGAGIRLFEALDRFLIAVLFYIFGVGMIKLFMPELFRDAELPRWLDIRDIKELKVLLWETVLVTLMVLSVTEIVTAKGELTWNALILPSVIVILSLSLFLMRSKVDTGKDEH